MNQIRFALQRPSKVLPILMIVAFMSVVTFATEMCGIMAIPTLHGQHAHLRLHEGSHDRRSKENVTADRLNALSTAALNGKPDPRVLFPH